MPTATNAPHCFPPVTNQQTRILILGSFPGVASLDVQQYYAHPRNQFWKLVSELIGVDLVTIPYKARLSVLLQHHIGLWDVIANAQRQGSLDSNIRHAVDNNLIGLLQTLPQLHTIGFNGGTAAKVGFKVLGDHARNYNIVTMPSSSPAHTMPFADKLAGWQNLVFGQTTPTD